MLSPFLKHMDATHDRGSDARSFPAADERRRAPRVDLPFPVIIRGVDAGGKSFTVQVVLDSMNACGLYVRLPQPIFPGARLFLVVRLSMTPDTTTAPSVAASGIVRRAELLADGTYGVAISFDRHRFLYAATSDA